MRKHEILRRFVSITIAATALALSVSAADTKSPPAAQPAADKKAPAGKAPMSDGQMIAADTLVRRTTAAGVRVSPVRERGLVGTLYRPAAGISASRRPAVIVLGGSQGGIPAPAAHAGGLASQGYVVLALAYFNAPGLPELLQNIPLEYVHGAAEWLKAQPEVDSSRVALMGTSRGAELALVVASAHPRAFRAVVANVPSSLVWPGLSDDSETPAWTSNGKALAAVPSNFSAADLTLQGRERFLRRMRDTAVTSRAVIQVERIAAPLLMFSAKDDQVWPSDVFAGQIERRLREHGFAHPVEHYSYENA